MKIIDLCRIHGISDATFYNWRTKYGAMEVSDAKRLKELQTENSRGNRYRTYRKDYNLERPHSSLNDMTPEEFAATFNQEQLTENTNLNLAQ